MSVFDSSLVKLNVFCCSGVKNAKLGITGIGEENLWLSDSQLLWKEKLIVEGQGVSKITEENDDLQVNAGEE